MKKYEINAKCGQSAFSCTIETDNQLFAAGEGKKAAYCYFASMYDIDTSGATTIAELTRATSNLPYRVQLTSVEEV